MIVSLLVLLAIISGSVVVLVRAPQQQIIALGVNGLVLALLFAVLLAPDVALAEIVVGAAVTPLLFLITLSSMRMDRRPDRET
ncbi:Na(+)/H(+) antiporter subunit B [Gluconacetobacter takamatsuzukensis]|uniref:DUF4040 domain-containing protein n=1 Tax=Gluconacetobacter takamatsuzukensis TaxID=1286190 RepID=A0A7W4KFU9_9PROT|nr:hydrogenase subunit MbhD domain-containing protein [Gluconacetobacter takamatsuzukensis]MBB2206118.1 DUF4040 domain-containing protein [Gluconacetobacter takamatsuzukensis]